MLCLVFKEKTTTVSKSLGRDELSSREQSNEYIKRFFGG